MSMQHSPPPTQSSSAADAEGQTSGTEERADRRRKTKAVEALFDLWTRAAETFVDTADVRAQAEEESEPEADGTMPRAIKTRKVFAAMATRYYNKLKQWQTDNYINVPDLTSIEHAAKCYFQATTHYGRLQQYNQIMARRAKEIEKASEEPDLDAVAKDFDDYLKLPTKRLQEVKELLVTYFARHKDWTELVEWQEKLFARSAAEFAESFTKSGRGIVNYINGKVLVFFLQRTGDEGEDPDVDAVTMHTLQREETERLNGRKQRRTRFFEDETGLNFGGDADESQLPPRESQASQTSGQLPPFPSLTTNELPPHTPQEQSNYAPNWTQFGWTPTRQQTTLFPSTSADPNSRASQYYDRLNPASNQFGLGINLRDRGATNQGFNPFQTPARAQNNMFHQVGMPNMSGRAPTMPLGPRSFGPGLPVGQSSHSAGGNAGNIFTQRANQQRPPPFQQPPPFPNQQGFQQNQQGGNMGNDPQVSMLSMFSESLASQFNITNLIDKKFDGSPNQYLNFEMLWIAADKRMSAMHFSPLQKFWELKKVLQGPALEYVQGLPINEFSSYEIALKTMRMLYTAAQPRLKVYCQQLMKIEPAHANFKERQKLHSALTQYYNSTAALGVDPEIRLFALEMCIIEEKFDDVMKREWMKYLTRHHDPEHPLGADVDANHLMGKLHQLMIEQQRLKLTEPKGGKTHNRTSHAAQKVVEVVKLKEIGYNANAVVAGQPPARRGPKPGMKRRSTSAPGGRSTQNSGYRPYKSFNSENKGKGQSKPSTYQKVDFSKKRESKNVEVRCIFCKDGNRQKHKHRFPLTCPELRGPKRLSAEAIKATAIKHGVCHNCFSPQHHTSKCDAPEYVYCRVENCGKRHNKVFHQTSRHA